MDSGTKFLLKLLPWPAIGYILSEYCGVWLAAIFWVIEIFLIYFLVTRAIFINCFLSMDFHEKFILIVLLPFPTFYLVLSGLLHWWIFMGFYLAVVLFLVILLAILIM